MPSPVALLMYPAQYTGQRRKTLRHRACFTMQSTSGMSPTRNTTSISVG